MINKNIKYAQRLIVLSLVVCSIAVNLGAFTRLVDAGLGCPDWPGCYGHVLWPNTIEEVMVANQAFPDTPVEAEKAWPEMVHRYFASMVGLLIICLLSLVWKTGPRKLAIGLLVAVCLQGAFGAWTVTLKLWPQVVTAHLLGGFTILSLLWLFAQRLFQWRWLSNMALSRLKPLAIVVTSVLVLQIALGGWTSSNYAALACTDFPTCHGSFFPQADFASGFDITQEVGPNYLGGQLDNDARVAIHLSHRLGAMVTTFLMLILLVMAWRRGDAMVRRWVIVTGCILVGQLLLGLSNIIFALPLSVAVLHNAGGALLLLSMVTFNHRLWMMKANNKNTDVIQEFNV